MTARPISQVAPPAGQDGDRLDFTDKNDLVNVPLVITTARTVNGKQGLFWVIEATRSDNGERVAFTGSTAIDRAMGAVKEAKAFPVAAMLTKHVPEDGGNWYWLLVDPPSNGTSDDQDRVAVVQSYLDAGTVTTADIKEMVANIAGEGKFVRDLSGEQWVTLVGRLSEIQTSLPPESEPPF